MSARRPDFDGICKNVINATIFPDWQACAIGCQLRSGRQEEFHNISKGLRIPAKAAPDVGGNRRKVEAIGGAGFSGHFVGTSRQLFY
jgi:hypothetical protein